MKRNELLWGGLLVAAGGLLLLENFGLFGSAQDSVWALLFAAGGAAFVGRFLTDRRHWWALIPGYTLLGLAAIIGLEALAPGLSARWSGPLFLAAIGLNFWTIYALQPRQWWAIIPGGVLATLAVVAGVDQALPGRATGGGIFFLGLATTFGLVYLLPTPPRSARWALFPAGVCGVLGLASLTATQAVLAYLWPAALILAGLYLLVRSFGKLPLPESLDEWPRPAPPKEERYDEPTLPQPH